MKDKNISDNQKYFPNRPKCFKFWEIKKEFNLALFVEMKKYAREIKKLQNQIKNQLPKNTNFLNDINKIEKNGLRKNGLYVYPPGDFHFTLINFLKHSVDFKYVSNLDSEELKKSVENYEHYKEKKYKIAKVIKKWKSHEVKADLRWIYSGDEKGIDSVSLQVFPELKFIRELKKIEKETKKYTDKLPWPNLGIKANPKSPKDYPRAFTTNILRFIKDTEKPKLSENLVIKDEEKLINFIEKVNKKHNDKPLITINFKEIILNEVNDAFFHKREKVQ